MLISREQVLLLSHHVIWLVAVTDQIRNCKLILITRIQIIQNTVGCFGNMILVPPMYNFIPHLLYLIMEKVCVLVEQGGQLVPGAHWSTNLGNLSLRHDFTFTVNAKEHRPVGMYFLCQCHCPAEAGEP